MSLHAALRNIGRVRVCIRQCARTKCRGLWREGETDVPDSVTPTVGLFLFFSLAPSSVLLLLLLPPLSLVLPSLSSLSLEPSVITAQSPGFYRRSDVATGSGGFRSDVGTIEKSIRIRRSHIARCRCCRARCSFSKIFIFRSVVLSSND